MDAILELKNVSKSFQNSDFALTDVSFSIPYGTIMGFIGENGAGKTTTISTILNTMKKDSGTIRIFGRELTDDATELREDIGVVFDAVNFSENLTAAKLDKVMDGIYQKWDHQRYFDLLRQFQLPEGQKIKTLSKGMSMKLAIAIALSHQPKLLILDEATSGLDPVVRDEILEVFLDFVQDDQHSILLSSHITTDLEKIADYITFIHQGKTILTAKKDDLLYRYGIIRCKTEQFTQMDKQDLIAYRKRDYQIDALTADRETVVRTYPDLTVDQPTIDEIMILLIKGEQG